MTAKATGRRTPRVTTKRITRFMLSTGLLVGATGTIGLVATSTPATALNSPITIAYITSVTGEGAVRARMDHRRGLQGKDRPPECRRGGERSQVVPLIIDDQTSPTAIATAVQDADSKAFAIVSQSPLFFFAAKYPQQAGVPVTGLYSDGPVWGQQPYTNILRPTSAASPEVPVTTWPGISSDTGPKRRHLRLRDLAIIEPAAIERPIR